MRKLPKTPYPECQRNMVKMVIEGSTDRSCNSVWTVYSPSLIHTLSEEHATTVSFRLVCTCLHLMAAFKSSFPRRHSKFLFSTATSQKQHRVSAWKSTIISKSSQQTLVSNRSVGMLFLVSVLYVFVKTTKLGHLLKSSLERMLSAQMGFLVSVQMKSH